MRQIRHRSPRKSRLADCLRTVTRLCVLGVLATTTAQAQVVLNEIMADNRSAVENGNDFPDYVELFNPAAETVSLDGMSLTDDPAFPRLFVFPVGTTIGAGGQLVVWCDSNYGSPGLHTGFALGAKGERVRLFASDGVTQVDNLRFGLQLPNLSVGRAPDGTGAWTLTHPTPRAANVAHSLGPISQLRLNEWMARPPSGNDWLELYNGHGYPVSLAGLVITDATSPAPTNRAIRALSFIGARGFIQFYASDLQQSDPDHLDFKLSSGGETLTLYDADRTTVLDQVTFGSQSEDVSQGRAPDGSDNFVFFPIGRATPGAASVAEPPGVVISEVLSHTDPPLEDAIELQNTTAAPVDVSHWWLSDAAAQPKKYRIPAGTVIPAGGHVVFYEFQIAAGTNGFTLDSSEGDEVFLSSGDTSGNLTGHQVFAEFGALKNGVSAGRHATTLGVDFVPLSRRTFGVDTPASVLHFRTGGGLPNAAPRVGPIVITEIMFRPPEISGDDEFLELHNPSDSEVPLFHPAYPTNAWRLRDGVTFNFPLNQTLPAGGFLLLVSFDPQGEPGKLAAFRSKYAVPTEVPVLGPYSGKLSDTGEAIELLWPDTPQPPDKPNAGFVPYEQVERIGFFSTAPWPGDAAGTGRSLQRRGAFDYGSEPTNWVTATPTAGRATVRDSDGDGMPDEWEATYGLAPHSSADADQDLDGDQATNLDEFLAGTNPTNSRNVFRISLLECATDARRITFRAVAGRTYSVQFREAAEVGSWQTLANIGSVAASGQYQVLLPPIVGARGVFRVVTPATAGP
jgi:hypothetical protein